MTLIEDAREGHVKITENMALPIIRDILVAVDLLHKGGILVSSNPSDVISCTNTTFFF